MHRTAWLLLMVSAGLAASGPSAKSHSYTDSQPDGPDSVHVTTLAFTPRPEWKVDTTLPKGKLPVFQNAAGDNVLLLNVISTSGKTSEEHLESAVRSMFSDSADRSKIERIDRKHGRWWMIDRRPQMRKIHAALFVPAAGKYFALCDVRLSDDKELEPMAQVCDTLAVTASNDHKP